MKTQLAIQSLSTTSTTYRPSAKMHPWVAAWFGPSAVQMARARAGYSTV